jgi:hypothetical protein
MVGRMTRASWQISHDHGRSRHWQCSMNSAGETDAMHPKLVPPKIDRVPEECVAGGTRAAVGSRQKGTCVTKCHRPENWVVVFFPAGFSYSPPNQRVQWHNGSVWPHEAPRPLARSAVVQ